MLLQAVSLPLLSKLSHASTCAATPRAERCTQGEDATSLIIRRSEEYSHIFREVYFKCCARQPREMLI